MKAWVLPATIGALVVASGASYAVKIETKGGSAIDIKFKSKIRAGYFGKRSGSDKSDLYFQVLHGRIMGKAKIHRYIKFVWQGDFNPKDNYRFYILDMFMLFDLSKEFKFNVGAHKVPFQRNSGLRSGWSFLTPTGVNYGHQVKAFTNPINKDDKLKRSGAYSTGATAWGILAGGLLKYYVGVYDTTDKDSSNNVDSAYAVRLQFTPIFLGYKPEKKYVLKETYLGKMDVLTLGAAYVTQKVKGNTVKSYGIDIMWEKKLGTITPNLQAGFVDHTNLGGNKNKDVKGYLVQGQILYNKAFLLGKPGLAFKWSKSDDRTSNDKDTTTVGGAINLYIKGTGNRITFSVDRVNRKSAKDYTDYIAEFWFNW